MVTVADAHKFLLYTPFQRYELSPGTTTMPAYTPIRHALNTDHNLFYMVQDKKLPERMYQDLKSNYLHNFNDFVELYLFLAAKMKYESLTVAEVARLLSYGHSVVGPRGAYIIGNQRLDVCDYLVRSLSGNYCIHRPEVIEERVDVKGSWLPAS